MAWTAQAATRLPPREIGQGAIGPTPIGSPAAAMVWLSLPLLLWGTAFWMVGAQAATPAAVLDRFESTWPDLPAAASLPASLTTDRLAVTSAALDALTGLETQCATVDAGSPDGSTDEPASDCGNPATLLRNLRITVTAPDAESATAVAQIVSFERRPSTLLWFIAGTELVPVPQQTVLTLDLHAVADRAPGWDRHRSPALADRERQPRRMST